MLFLIVCAVFLLSVNAKPLNNAGIELLDNILKDTEESKLNHNEELGNHFEGDMVLSLEQYYAIMENDESRNALKDLTKRWPGGVVTYHIEEDDFDENQTMQINSALADIASSSCIKFKLKENDNEHAVIIQGSESGCYSNVGHSGGNNNTESDQVLNLGKGCFRHGTIIHEMLHTLGFYHMQSTYDRDDFVTVVWDNIQKGREHNFIKYTKDTVTDFGVPYDYDSVMHYPSVAFSRNGNATIIPKEDNVRIGQRGRLSESDLLKLKKMYCDPARNEDRTKKIKLGFYQ